MCLTRNFTLDVAGFNYPWVCGVMIVVAQITCWFYTEYFM